MHKSDGILKQHSVVTADHSGDSVTNVPLSPLRPLEASANSIPKYHDTLSMRYSLSCEALISAPEV